MAAASSEVLLLASGLPAVFSPILPSVLVGKPSATASVVDVSAAFVEVGDGWLDVKGTSLPDEAPGKAVAGPSDSVPLAGEESLADSTLSSTCSTPLESRMSAVMTRARLTKTSPSRMVMVTLSPPRVGTEPLASVLLYATVPLITWYCSTEAASSVLMLASTELMLWKAALLGAKMVRSGVVFRASVRSVALTAPRKAVRLASWATVLTFGGMESSPSMMWMTPPLNSMFWLFGQ